jgi:hypothetical protein
VKSGGKTREVKGERKGRESGEKRDNLRETMDERRG